MNDRLSDQELALLQKLRANGFQQDLFYRPLQESKNEDVSLQYS